MRKPVKHGVHSGNTFRFGKVPLLFKHFGKDQEIVMKSVYLPSGDYGQPDSHNSWMNLSTDIVEDGNINLYHYPMQEIVGRWRHAATHQPPEIPMTLNKRKRWLLPELLKGTIDEIKNGSISSMDDNGRPYKITMVERVIMSGPQPVYYGRGGISQMKYDCVGYHDSSTQLSHVSPTRPFSFGSDLIRKAKGDSTPEKTDKVMKKKTERRLKTRSHTRGVQRLHAKKEGWFDVMRRMRNEESQAPVAEPSVVEIKYEICHKRPMMAHRFCYDNGHKERFPWTNRRNHPRMALKKMTRAGFQAIVKCSKKSPNAVGILRDNVYTSKLCKDWSEEWFDQYDKIENEDEKENHDEEFFEQRFVRDAQYIGTEIKASEETNDDICGESETDNSRSCGYTLADFLVQKTEKRNRNKKREMPISACHVATCNSASSQLITMHGKGEAIFTRNNTTKPDSETNNSEIVDNLPKIGPVTIENQASVDESSFVIVLGHDKIDTELLEDLDREMKHFTVRVPRSTIAPVRLHEVYGSHFGEAFSRPTKFVIDLTTRCNNEITDIKRETTQEYFKSDQKVELLCEETDSHEDDDVGSEFVIIRFRIIGNLQECVFPSVAEQFQEFFGGISCCLDFDTFVAKVVDTCSRFSFPRERITLIAADNRQHHFVNTACDWSVVCYKPEQAYQVILNQVSDAEPACSNVAYSVHLSPPPPHYCDICYDVIDGRNLRATALIECGHWFCDRCWQRHIICLLRQKALTLQCPGTGCKCTVDHVTLLSLLPWHYVDKYLSYKSEAAIEKEDTTWSWCPSPKCGRVIRQQTDGNRMMNGCVACVCGKTWCFKCHKDPHWPATCTQAANYDKLNENCDHKGDKRLNSAVTTFVKVKRCPNCKYPIEKDGGCSQMACSRCRSVFCWECLVLVSMHVNFQPGGCKSSLQEFETIELDYQQDVRLNQYYYHMAISQRWKRIDQKGEYMRKKLLNWCIRYVRRNMVSARRSAHQTVQEIFCKLCSEYASVASFELMANQVNDLIQLADLFRLYWTASSFCIEARFVLEFGYVRLISSTRKRNAGFRERLSYLQTITESIEWSLMHMEMRQEVKAIVRSLSVKLASGTTCLRQLAITFKHRDRITSPLSEVKKETLARCN